MLKTNVTKLKAILGMLLYAIAIASIGVALGGVILAISTGSAREALPYMLAGWLGLCVSGLYIWKFALRQIKED